MGSLHVCWLQPAWSDSLVPQFAHMSIHPDRLCRVQELVSVLYGSVGQVIEDRRDCSARTFRDCSCVP